MLPVGNLLINPQVNTGLYPRDMDIYERRLAVLQEVMAQKRLIQRDLAEKLGVVPNYVSRMLGGRKSIGTEMAERLEVALDLLPGTILAPGSGDQAVNSDRTFPEAHGVSQPRGMMVPRQIAWDELMLGPLPESFVVQIRDDAMAPEFPIGCECLFSTAAGQPKPRDGVLVADDAGNVYFREYQVGPGGRWQAASLNSGYLPMTPEAHRISVIAVLTGKLGRRSG